MSFTDAFGSPWEIAKAGWVAVAAVVTWIGRDHIKQDRETAKAYGKRIAAVELQLNTKLDTLTTKVADNHAEVLKILIDRLPPPPPHI